MSDPRTRALIGGDSVPRFARGVRLRFDGARGQWVLLAPERVLMPDETGVAILERVDGKATVDAVIDALATRFAAPRAVIAADVIALLQELADKGCVDS